MLSRRKIIRRVASWWPLCIKKYYVFYAFNEHYLKNHRCLIEKDFLDSLDSDAQQITIEHELCAGWWTAGGFPRD